MSDTQLPILFLLTEFLLTELLYLSPKDYNQPDFSIDHLLMSMCRIVSCVV